MAEEEIEESGGGSKGKMIVIIIVILLLLIGAAVGAMMFLGDDEAPPAEDQSEATMLLEQEMQNKSQNDAIRIEEPIFLPPKKYTVNLRDGKHFLQIELTAVLKDQMAVMYLAKREFLVDDRINSMLQSLRTEDLRRANGTELLKRELLRMINSLYTPEFIDSTDSRDRTPVKEVLITSIVLN